MAITNFIGLGPPDLVVLEKAYNPPKMLIPGIIKHARYSYFHWTLGNDVSSGAAVATYLGFLLEKQEKQSIGRGSFVIDKCINCSYNAFRKMDLRVEITVPELARKHSGFNIAAYAVDAVGTRHQVDEIFWKETQVCAMLRFIEGPPQSLRPIKIKDSLCDPVAEQHFLSLCAEVFPKAKKLGNPENGYSLYGVDASNNLLTSTLCKYFIKYNRFDNMISFFDAFINVDPTVAVPIAYAEAMLDRTPRALTLLDSSSRRKPESSTIKLSIAELNLLNLPFGLDRHIKLLDTLKLILNGITLQPQLARGWWILAKCLIEMGRYEWSLVILNNAPVVNEDYANKPVDLYGNPHFEKFTSPEVYIHHILSILQDENQNFRDGMGDASLRLLAAPTISPDEKTVYSLLSDIISRSSWDHLTKIRTRVLVRPAEMVRAKQRFLKGEPLSSEKALSDTLSLSQQLQRQTSSNSVVIDPQMNNGVVIDSHMSNTTVVEPQVTVESETEREIESETDDSSDHKDEGKDNSLRSSASSYSTAQQSSEFSPVELERGRKSSTEAYSKDQTTMVQPENDLSHTQVILQSSTDSLQEVNISSEKESSPDFHISRDLDVDDALTKFLVKIISLRSSISAQDVPTTPMNISRNVDVAFHAIFQDIKAFHAWKEEEKKLNLAGVEDIPLKSVPHRSVVDWIRIANMCERLSFTKDAHKIYKMVENNHVRALCAIVSADAERGDIKSTLLDASQLLSSYYKYNVSQPHPVAVSAIVKLISSQGAHKVRSMQSSLPNLHPLLVPVVQDSVRWKSKGFDQ